MGAFKALREFYDLEDGGHFYRAGDDYPRPGFAPGEKRLHALSTADNRQGCPLIAPKKSGRKKANADDAG